MDILTQPRIYTYIYFFLLIIMKSFLSIKSMMIIEIKKIIYCVIKKIKQKWCVNNFNTFNLTIDIN